MNSVTGRRANLTGRKNDEIYPVLSPVRPLHCCTTDSLEGEFACSDLTGWHFLIILVVILLLFGAPKLPGLARSLGQSMKIFKSEITPERTDDGTPVGSADSTHAESTRADSTRTDSTRADPSGTPNPKA